MKKRHIFGGVAVAVVVVAGALLAVSHHAFNEAREAGLAYDAAHAPQLALSEKSMTLFHDCKLKSQHGEGEQASSDIGAFTDCFSPFATQQHPQSMAPALLLLSVIAADPQAMSTRQAILVPLAQAAKDGFDAEIEPAVAFDAKIAKSCSNPVTAWGCRRAVPGVYEQTPQGLAFAPRAQLIAKAAREADIAIWQSTHPAQAASYGAKIMVARVRPGPALDELVNNPPWVSDLAPIQKQREERIQALARQQQDRS